MMGKVLMYGAVLVAALATAMPELTGYYGLVLVAVGLAAGFMKPLDEVTHRIAYYVLAATLPAVADNLDAIPAVGSYANSFLDAVAVFIAGVALANVMLQLLTQVKNA
jgi:hypothetical protein